MRSRTLPKVPRQSQRPGEPSMFCVELLTVANPYLYGAADGAVGVLSAVDLELAVVRRRQTSQRDRWPRSLVISLSWSLPVRHFALA